MPAGIWDFTLEQNSDFYRVMRIRQKDAEGVLQPVNLLGYFLKMQLRRVSKDFATNNQILIELSTTNGGIVLHPGGEVGKIALVISAANTLNFNAVAAKYSLELHSPGGAKRRLLEGSVKIKPAITV